MNGSIITTKYRGAKASKLKSCSGRCLNAFDTEAEARHAMFQIIDEKVKADREKPVECKGS